MSATFVNGLGTIASTEQITNTKLQNLVNNATVSGIVNAEISASAAIAASKLDLSTVAQAVQMSGKRFGLAQGAAVASATTVTLGADGNVFHITGTTTITGITALSAPALVVLIFDGVLTLTDGSNLKLAGNFVTTADDTITLWCDGTNYYELCRSVN